MKMNFRYRSAVGFAFSFGDESVDCHHVLLYLPGKMQMSSHNVFDIVEAAVVVAMSMVFLLMMVMSVVVFMVVKLVVVMVMVLVRTMVVLRAVLMVDFFLRMSRMGMLLRRHIHAFFFLAAYRYGDMGSCNTAFYRWFPGDTDPGKTESV